MKSEPPGSEKCSSGYNRAGESLPGEANIGVFLLRVDQLAGGGPDLRLVAGRCATNSSCRTLPGNKGLRLIPCVTNAGRSPDDQDALCFIWDEV
jgi:hypothetical protein